MADSSSSKTKINENLPASDNDVTAITNDNNDDQEAEDFVQAIQLVQSGVLPWVLHTAMELDLIGIIARSGHRLSATDISAHLVTTTKKKNHDAPLMLDRMLRLLANYSIISCSVVRSTETNGESSERQYGLGRLSKFFLPDQGGASLGPLLALFMDKVVQATWTKLKDAILEGEIPFNMVHGVHAFEYQCLDPRFNEVFNKALSNYPNIIIKNILQKYNGFEGVKLLVDVGGGFGHTLHAIISKHPSIRGINFDLPHVILNAPSYHGVEHVSGDMFESVPKGDAILIKWVLQVWSDEQCLKLLKNCYKAIPDTGKLIIVESIVEEEAETTVVAKAISQMDVYMMTKNPGGREKTHNEFLALAKAAGFAGIRLDCQVGQIWVMEFYK